LDWRTGVLGGYSWCRKVGWGKNPCRQSFLEASWGNGYRQETQSQDVSLDSRFPSNNLHMMGFSKEMGNQLLGTEKTTLFFVKFCFKLFSFLWYNDQCHKTVCYLWPCTSHPPSLDFVHNVKVVVTMS
jgi:hypothetical protein